MAYSTRRQPRGNHRRSTFRGAQRAAALRLGRPRTDPMVAQAALLEAVARHASEFDIIHAHTDWLHLPLLSRLGVPFVTTCHGRMDLPGFADVVRRFPNAPFISISDNQRVPL